MQILLMAMVLAGTGEVQRDAAVAPPLTEPQLLPGPPLPRPAPPVPPMPPARWRPPQRIHPNLNFYFRADDYPAAAQRARHEGTTTFSLDIAANGRVTD